MITLILNENRVSRSLTSERRVYLSEISADITGVRLYYSDSALTTEEIQHSISILQKVFPNHYFEKHSVRISLGEFIDMLSKII